MQLRFLPLIASVGLAWTAALAQSGGDASDLFLNAYMAFQKGEKSEATGDARGAIRAFNQAITTLDQIGQRYPSWNPPIVKHRRDRAAEALAKLQSKTPGTAPAARPDAGPIEPPPLPERDLLPPDAFPAGDLPAVGEPGRKPRAGADPITEIQDRMATLKRDLDAARERLAKAAEEKAEMARQLEEALTTAKASAKKAEVLQSRADRAEKSLLDAEKSGTKNSDELAALRAEVTKSKKQLRLMQYERDAEAELREGITGRYKAAAQKAASLGEVPKKLVEMQKEIDRVLSEKGDLETKLAKVEQQLQQVTVQRDEAVAQVSKMKEAQKNVAKLLDDNTALMAKLGAAEKQITVLKAEGVKKDDDIKRLNVEMSGVRKQLAEAQKQSAEYQTQMTDLRKQLDTQARELTLVRSDVVKTAAERERLVKENDLLRGIVLRAQKAQADREQTKKLVLTELAKLEVNSKALTTQIDLLGSPVVKLSEREKNLFKQPVLSIGDADISFGAPKESTTEPPKPTVAEATPVEAADPAPSVEVAANTPPQTPAPKPAEPQVADATAAQTPPAPEPKEDPTKVADAAPATGPNISLAADVPPPPLPEELPPLTIDSGKPKGSTQEMASAKPPAGVPGAERKSIPLEGELPARDPGDQKAETIPGPGVKTAPEPAVPPELIGLAREAKDQFERGNYREAEKIYQKALAKAPNNLYILSNQGVVYFRGQKYKLAEEAFKKAIAIAPEDDFSHCTLGIVYYSQGKLDEAINELTKALAINPKNATAHNYLGITASQKGWQEAAMKELETATALDPNYADAHFNLAVVFATITPPNKEGARQHYKRATELGAEPDSALEQMLK